MVIYSAQIWAADDIEKGEKLEICYTHVSHCTLQRRRHLKESKFFDCDCKRCSDPTELGTNLSSMRCNNCENGIILASDPLGECVLLFFHFFVEKQEEKRS